MLLFEGKADTGIQFDPKEAITALNIFKFCNSQRTINSVIALTLEEYWHIVDDKVKISALVWFQIINVILIQFYGSESNF